MGNSNSSHNVAEEFAKNEQQVAEIEEKLKTQLDGLKQEVIALPPLIKENVRAEVIRSENVKLIRFSELEDKEVLVQAVKNLFGKFPLVDMLIDVVQGMVATIKGSESGEVKEILSWEQHSQKRRLGEELYGMEYHYTVRIYEECKGWSGFKKKNTVLMIAWKAATYTMSGDPKDFPTKDTLNELMQ